ncbi:hypothetical protein AO376_1834 [Moraxella catarrhalis]|nr:hypothetical protein AO376_1834 [Moraxella catarrhalis]OAV18749.1 hypothetical protein AO374_0955 [Moraxella catarrhalis]
MIKFYLNTLYPSCYYPLSPLMPYVPDLFGAYGVGAVLWMIDKAGVS